MSIRLPVNVAMLAALPLTAAFAAARADTIHVDGLQPFRTEIIRAVVPGGISNTLNFATLEWVDWWNRRRLLEPIGNIPPAKFEQLYYEQSHAPAMVAGLT